MSIFLSIVATNQKMKIGFVIQNINKNLSTKGGAERVLIELANELIVRKHDVTIFCIDTKNRDEFMYPILPEVKDCNLIGSSNGLIDRIKFEFFINVAKYRDKIYKKVNQLIQIPSSLFKNSDPPKPLSSEKTPSKLSHYASEYSWRLLHLAFRYIFNWQGIIKQHKPDILIFFMPSRLFIHVPYMLTDRDFPIVFSFHNILEHNLKWVKRIHPAGLAKFNKSLELIDAITVLLPEGKTELPELLQNKVHIIPNPIPQIASKERSKPATETEPKTILAVGRLVEQKNHSVLVESFARVSHQYPNWQVKIFGDGKLREELTSQIHELELQDRIILMGNTDNIYEQYRKAHVFAMPSKFEGFGLTLVEAMAHGLPSVGFDNAKGVNYLVQHEYNGLLADGNNPVESLAACLEKLIVNAEMREKLGQNGIETAKLYTPEKVYDLWEETLIKIKDDFTRKTA